MAVTIANRDRSGVVSRLRLLGRTFTGNRLLPDPNTYRVNTIASLGSTPPRTKLLQKHLADYIACSSIFHMTDAWGFLSRATMAAICGDTDSATHLGYYAELRAVMSILASEGVGVMNNSHYVIDINGRTQAGGSGGTHTYCWKAFSEWATTGGGWQQFSHRLKPNGISLSMWTAAFPSFAAVPAIARNTLQSFGLDVGRLAHDKDLRNESSYRPTAFRGLKFAQVADELSIQARMAESLISSGKFGDCPLATAILSHVLLSCFRGGGGRSPSIDPNPFRMEVRTMVAAVGHPQPTQVEDQIVNFAISSSGLIENALGTLRSDQFGHHREVLARATILCFLSSIFTRDLLDDAGIPSTALDFWIESFAAGRGVFDPPGPMPITDLWTDLENAVSDLDNIATRNPSQAVMHTSASEAIASLCRYERVAFLGLVS